MKRLKFACILWIGICLIGGCFTTINVSAGQLEKAFPNDPGFYERGFQVLSETERVYFNDRGKIYAIDINDPEQKRILVCHVGGWYFKFSVSPDEKYLVYVDNNNGKATIVDINSGKKRILGFKDGHISSIMWSKAKAKQLYFAYWRYYPAKETSGILSLSFEGDEKYTTIIKEGVRAGLEICQVLSNDDLVYLSGREYHLYETYTGNDYFLAKGAVFHEYYPEHNFKLSPDRKWAAILLLDNSIWFVRLKDTKGYMVSESLGSRFIIYGIDFDIKRKRFYIVLGEHRKGIYLAEDVPIIPPKKYPTQIYFLNLNKILQVFEGDTNLLKDFSDRFYVLRAHNE